MDGKKRPLMATEAIWKFTAGLRPNKDTYSSLIEAKPQYHTQQESISAAVLMVEAGMEKE